MLGFGFLLVGEVFVLFFANFPLVNSEEAEVLDEHMDACFTVCENEGVDIYELALIFTNKKPVRRYPIFKSHMDNQQLERGNELKAQIIKLKEYKQGIILYKESSKKSRTTIHLGYINTNERPVEVTVQTRFSEPPECASPYLQFWCETLVPGLLAALDDGIQKLENEFASL